MATPLCSQCLEAKLDSSGQGSSFIALGVSDTSWHSDSSPERRKHGLAQAVGLL